LSAVHIAKFDKLASPWSTYLVDPRTAFACRNVPPPPPDSEWPDEALPEIGLNQKQCVVVVTIPSWMTRLMVALPSPAIRGAKSKNSRSAGSGWLMD
jgi:hypothetical protein